MSDDMTDDFFLGYVDIHSDTPRALYSPEHAERLFRLAGVPLGRRRPGRGLG